MKIAFLTERMLLGYGVDLVVHEQASRLQALGHDVTVFAERADATTKRDYALHVLSSIVPGFHDYVNEGAIRSFLARSDIGEFDLWLLHTPPFYAWIKYIEKPVVIVEHGSPPGHFFDQVTAYHLWKSVSTHHSETYSWLREGDAIISISQNIHNALPKHAQPYSTVIYHGADHYSKAHLGEVLRFRNKCGAKEDDFLVLWVGRMQFDNDEQPYKGFPELLALLPKIRKIAPRKVKVACVGKIAPDEMRRFDKIDATLLAQLPSEQMGVAFGAADVLLNLSKWEGFNLALVESQFQGTPVVAYDVGPHAEVTDPDRSALLVQDTDGVIAALRRLQRDGSLRAEMARSAEQFASRFSWEENSRQLEALLVGCGRSYSEAKPARRLRKGRIQPSGFAACTASVDNEQPAESAIENTGSFAGQDASSSSFSEINPSDGAQENEISDEKIDELLALDDTAFVDGAYWLLLGRFPDVGGRDYYLGRLAVGKSKISVLRDIVASPECQRRKLILPRRLANTRAMRLQAYIHDRTMRYSREQIKHLDSVLDLEGEAFVHAAFRLLLGRPADETGLQKYSSWLRQTGDKLAILIDLLRVECPPSMRRRRSRLCWSLRWRHFFRGPVKPPIMKLNDIAFVREAYQLALGRTAEEGGLLYHVNRLRKIGDKYKVLLDICLSPEGRSRMAEHELLRRALKRYRRVSRKDPSPSIASLLAPLYEQSDRLALLERRLHEIEVHSRNLTGQAHLLLEMADRREGSAVGGVDGLGKPLTKLSPPYPYRVDLNRDHVCLHAPGVQIDEHGYDRLAHLAAITDADIVFGDEWIVLEHGEQVPVLRTAFSPFAFAEAPDLGGVIAVRRELLVKAQLPETVMLTGEVLLRLVSLAHTIVHHPNLLSLRNAVDLRGNAPSEAAILAYTQRDHDAGMAARGQNRFDVRRTPPLASVCLIIVICDDEKAERNGRQAAPDSNHIRYVARKHGTAAINAAVQGAPAECHFLAFIDEELKPDSVDWLDRMCQLATNANVGLVSGLAITKDNRINNAGWQVGPRGLLRPRARLRPHSTVPDAHEELVDPVMRLNEVSAVDLCYAAMRRSVFLDIGGLDEKLCIAQAGLDLSIRLRSLQLSVLFNGRIIARGLAPMLTLAIGNGAESKYFFQKHQEKFRELDPFSALLYEGGEIYKDIHREIVGFDINDHRKTIIAPILE